MIKIGLILLLVILTGCNAGEQIIENEDSVIGEVFSEEIKEETDMVNETSNPTLLNETFQKKEEIIPIVKIILSGEVNEDIFKLSWTTFYPKEIVESTLLHYNSESVELENNLVEFSLSPKTYGTYDIKIETKLKNKSSIYSNPIQLIFEDNRVLKGEELGSKSNEGYLLRFGDVWFDGEKILNADLQTFRVYKNLGVDKNSVYSGTEVLENIDPYSFETKGEKITYVLDEESVYYASYGKKLFISNDVLNFKVNEEFEYYSSDSKNVYYNGEKLDDVDPKTFEFISIKKSTFFFKDKDNYYYLPYSSRPIVKIPVEKKIKIIYEYCAYVDEEYYYSQGERKDECY